MNHGKKLALVNLGWLTTHRTSVTLCGLTDPLGVNRDLPFVSSPPKRHHPMALAMEWVSRIMAIAMVMLLPGFLGQWLDRRFGTTFLVPVGLVVGLTVGMAVLIYLTKNPPGTSGKRFTPE